MENDFHLHHNACTGACQGFFGKRFPCGAGGRARRECRGRAVRGPEARREGQRRGASAGGRFSALGRSPALPRARKALDMRPLWPAGCNTITRFSTAVGFRFFWEWLTLSDSRPRNVFDSFGISSPSGTLGCGTVSILLRMAHPLELLAAGRFRFFLEWLTL